MFRDFIGSNIFKYYKNNSNKKNLKWTDREFVKPVCKMGKSRPPETSFTEKTLSTHTILAYQYIWTENKQNPRFWVTNGLRSFIFTFKINYHPKVFLHFDLRKLIPLTRRHRTKFISSRIPNIVYFYSHLQNTDSSCFVLTQLNSTSQSKSFFSLSEGLFLGKHRHHRSHNLTVDGSDTTNVVYNRKGSHVV